MNYTAYLIAIIGATVSVANAASEPVIENSASEVKITTVKPIKEVKQRSRCLSSENYLKCWKARKVDSTHISVAPQVFMVADDSPKEKMIEFVTIYEDGEEEIYSTKCTKYSYTKCYNIDA